MRAQPLWRGSISILEKPNGYYDVFVTERLEHGDHNTVGRYDNLSWAEVEDLIGPTIEHMSKGRQVAFQRTLDTERVQLNLLDS